MSDVSAMSNVCAMSDNPEGYAIDKESHNENSLWAVSGPTHLY